MREGGVETGRGSIPCHYNNELAPGLNVIEVCASGHACPFGQGISTGVRGHDGGYSPRSGTRVPPLSEARGKKERQ